MRRNHRQRLGLWSIQGCGASNPIRLFTQNTSTSRHHVCSKSCLGRGTGRPGTCQRRQPRALICFRRCLFLVRWSRRWLRAHALAFVTGHEGFPCACALYATCRTTFAPSLHLFCGTAAHERTWFRDASTSRHAFTSIASFPALAHDWVQWRPKPR